MITYVLIIILTRLSYDGSPAIITQEFKTFESCEAAKSHIIEQLDKNNYIQINSRGCFKK